MLESAIRPLPEEESWMTDSGRDLRAFSGKVDTGFPQKMRPAKALAAGEQRHKAERDAAYCAPAERAGGLAPRLGRAAGVAGARAGEGVSADAGSLASCSITRKRATFFWC